MKKRNENKTNRHNNGSGSSRTSIFRREVPNTQEIAEAVRAPPSLFHTTWLDINQLVDNGGLETQFGDRDIHSVGLRRSGDVEYLLASCDVDMGRNKAADDAVRRTNFPINDFAGGRPDDDRDRYRRIAA